MNYKDQLIREREAICRFLANIDGNKARAVREQCPVTLQMLEWDEEVKTARLVEIDAALKLLS